MKQMIPPATANIGTSLPNFHRPIFTVVSQRQVRCSENWEWEGDNLSRAVDLVSALPPCFFKNALSGLMEDWDDQDPGAAIA